MTGVQDHIVTIGKEAVAFGTKAATLTRGIENQAGNEPAPNYELRESRGMRPSAVATPDDRYITIPRNGKVPLQFDLMSKSHGIVLAGASSASDTLTTPVGATNARLLTCTPSTTGPTRSYSIHHEIPESDAGSSSVNQLGAMLETLTVSVQPRGFVNIKAEYDYATDDLAASTVTPAYPTSPYVYKAEDTTVTVDSTDVCVRSANIVIPTGIKTDLDRVCPDGRRQPLTTGRIVATGTIGVDYVSTALWAKWKAGTAIPIVLYAEGPEIDTGVNNAFFRVTLAAVRLTGNAAQRALDDLTSQELAFQVVWNGTDDPWKIEYQTSDTTA